MLDPTKRRSEITEADRLEQRIVVSIGLKENVSQFAVLGETAYPARPGRGRPNPSRGSQLGPRIQRLKTQHKYGLGKIPGRPDCAIQRRSRRIWAETARSLPNAVEIRHSAMFSLSDASRRVQDALPRGEQPESALRARQGRLLATRKKGRENRRTALKDVTYRL
jgi:hypothetical protein